MKNGHSTRQNSSDDSLLGLYCICCLLFVVETQLNVNKVLNSFVLGGFILMGMSLESFPCVHIFICMTLLVSIVLGTDLVPHDKFPISKANDLYILAQQSLGVTRSWNPFRYSFLSAKDIVLQKNGSVLL
jgi:hypothetical protein